MITCFSIPETSHGALTPKLTNKVNAPRGDSAHIEARQLSLCIQNQAETTSARAASRYAGVSPLCRRGAALALRQLASDGGEREPLPAGRIEIVRRQPGFKRRSPQRPVAVGHRVPGSVPVAPFDHHVLAEHALVDKSEPLRGPFGRLVERVAFPFQPAVAKVVESVPGKEID